MLSEKRIKQQLVKYGRRIAHAGFVIGSGGNISLRYKNLVFIKAKDVNMAEAGEDEYLAIDLKTGKPQHQCIGVGRRVRQRPFLPSSEYRMHILCYQGRSDIRALIHTHPVFCVALSSKINPVRNIRSARLKSKSLANTGGRIRVIPYIQPGTLKLAQAVSRVVKQDNAVILARHGLVCVGRSLEQAFLRCQTIERACLIHILRKI
jgi:L-fuculose-phosphate aldolase